MAFKDTEMILKILISLFLDNISLKFVIDFILNFWVNLSLRANDFCSGLADIKLDQFQNQKLALIIFLKMLYLKGSKFAFGLKVSRVLAMIIFLFSMNVLVSQFFEMISVVFFIKIDKRKKVAQQTTLKCFKNADNFLGAGEIGWGGG